MKKLLFVLLTFIMTAIAPLAITSANQLENTPFTTYSNSRFNYQVVYPDIFDIKVKSDNGDGQTFELSGMSTHCILKVWGKHNLDNQNGFGVLEERKNNVAYISFDEASPDHYKIIYSDDGGKDGNETIFYEYGIVKKDRIASFLFTFSYDLKDYYIPLIEKARIRFVETPSWLTLVDAIAYSQSLHLNEFNEKTQADTYTINNTLYYLVQKGYFHDKYPGHNISENKYSFSDGPESCDVVAFDKEKYTSAENLYAAYFTNGSYLSPDADVEKVTGTQTGILVSLEKPIFNIKTQITKVKNKHDKKIIEVDITRYNTAIKKAVHIGKAVITLKRDDLSYFGYTISGFSPKYKQIQN